MQSTRAHSDCGRTCGCAGKTVKSIENTCHTWPLLRWWFTTKRRYIKFMHLYLYRRWSVYLALINHSSIYMHQTTRIVSINEKKEERKEKFNTHTPNSKPKFFYIANGIRTKCLRTKCHCGFWSKINCQGRRRQFSQPPGAFNVPAQGVHLELNNGAWA